MLFLFLQICSLCYSRISAQSDDCRTLQFKSAMEGYYFQGHVFKSIKVLKESQCDAKCYVESTCVSFNVVSSLVDGVLTCELSNSDHEMHPEALQRQFGSIYQPFENACLKTPCPLHSTCQNGFTDKGYRCIGNKQKAPAASIQRTQITQWSQTSQGPQTTQWSQTSQGPQTTQEAQTTRKLHTNQQTQTTQASQATLRPQTTQEPQATEAPQASQGSQITQQTQTTQATLTNIGSQTNQASLTTIGPQTTQVPQATAEPQTSQAPQDSHQQSTQTIQQTQATQASQTIVRTQSDQRPETTPVLQPTAGPQTSQGPQETNPASQTTQMSQTGQATLTTQTPQITQAIQTAQPSVRYPETCGRVKANLSDTSGLYVIDPDGLEGEAPFQVYCNMTDKDGIGVTVVSHDTENRTHVTGCMSDGCYKRDVNYNGVSFSQLTALTDVSTHCEQFISYECKGSKLLRGNKAWWVSRDGLRMNHWGGTSESGWCGCAVTGTCAKSNMKCNCNIDDYLWREDSGLLFVKDYLPVSQLRFGDTEEENEEGYHTLGKLRCY